MFFIMRESSESTGLKYEETIFFYDLWICKVSSARSKYISYGPNATGPISPANKTIIHESLNSVFMYDYVNTASG